MPTQGNTSVLVVGSGPSGLAAALTLALNGVSVRVIEKERKPRLGHRGAGVQPRTQELHQLLGTWDDIRTKGIPLAPIVAYSPVDGKTEVKRFNMFEVEEPTSAAPNVNTLNLSQERHEAILREHLAKLGCHVEFGEELVTLSQDADEVHVTLRRLSDGSEENATYPWVVGADGGQSAVRKQLGLAFLGETKEVSAFISGDIYCNGDLSTDVTHFWGAPPTKLACLMPTEYPGSKRFFFGLADDSLSDAELPSTKEDIIRMFERLSGRDDLKLGELVWSGTWRPNIRMVETFKQGRVFLSGDAAHCHPPTGAQGMNTSVQDAVNLGWKLSLVIHDQAPFKLLDSYTAERLPVVASMLELTSGLLDKMYLAKDVSTGFTRERVTKMLGVTYRGSPIVVPSPEDVNLKADPYRSGEDGTLRAGDRAPDATAGIMKMFSVKHHVVLIFGLHGEDAEEAVRIAREAPAPFKTALVLHQGTNAYVDIGADWVLEDSDGSAVANYQVEHEGIVVVRPDGVVGVKADGVDGLKKYIELVFT